MNLKDQAVKHGPATAAATVAAIVTSVIMRPAPLAEVSIGGAPSRAALVHRATSGMTHIGGCPDAVLSIDEDAQWYIRGQVSHACERLDVVFAEPWPTVPTCQITGGHIASATTTGLVINGSNNLLTFDCGH